MLQKLRQQDGMTLIDVLVALVVIAIVVVAVSIAYSVYKSVAG